MGLVGAYESRLTVFDRTAEFLRELFVVFRLLVLVTVAAFLIFCLMKFLAGTTTLLSSGSTGGAVDATKL